MGGQTMLLTRNVRLFSMLIFLGCSYCCGSLERTRCSLPSKPSGYSEQRSYYCPTVGHSVNEFRCCEPFKYGCCRVETFFEKYYFAIVYGSSLLMIIILTIVISICLCSERCLLHKLVRRRPSLDYIARPEEVEHLAGLAVPSDELNESHSYEVNPEVSYKEKKDVF